MSDKTVISKNDNNEFLEINNIQGSGNIGALSEDIDVSRSKTEFDSDFVEFLNSISTTLEKSLQNSTNSDNHDKNNFKVDDMANALKPFFEEKNYSFEWYQRAGKFFFHCEHEHNEEQSEIMKKSLKFLVEEKLGRKNTHYATTSNCVSVVFR